MGLIVTVKQMGIRIWDSNNRSLGTILGCIGGFAVGLTAVLSHDANLPILGVPNSIAYKIIAVCLATGIGGNLSSYIGASIDILTNEKTIFDLIEHCLVRWGCMQKRQPSPQTAEVAPVEGHKQHFPFITSTIPKDGVVEERRRTSFQGLPNNMIRPLVDKLTEIQSQLQKLVSQTEPARTESPQLRHLSLSIAEPIEFTSETVISKLEAISEQLRILEHNHAHQGEIIESFKEANRKLKQALREAQAKNGQLAESIMQRRNSQETSDSRPAHTPSSLHT